MGLNKKYLPDLEKIKEEYEKSSPSDFIKKYSKYEVFIGPIESINFIEKIINTKI